MKSVALAGTHFLTSFSAANSTGGTSTLILTTKTYGPLELY